MVQLKIKPKVANVLPTPPLPPQKILDFSVRKNYSSMPLFQSTLGELEPLWRSSGCSAGKLGQKVQLLSEIVVYSVLSSPIV